ncbi:conserved hypothetical protein [Methanococcus vannielii SB]|uniref:Transglutaminase-like domain-containing protein n=1 Tax=Methanococcus vannielii (strain ATCC 35089 / DSM 1224 / JCM 13029 / OCM 148 / SB) TaxID=406327 RepID=A6USM9_METVS|nr:hypothetical protein [Methanococcus vannielii]ABR55501.1 conserved hypothetical protein [Methanococcus vannielii SB]
MKKIVICCIILFTGLCGCILDLNDFFDYQNNVSSEILVPIDLNSFERSEELGNEVKNQEINEIDEYYIRTYVWNYNGDEWSWDLKIPKSAFEYYSNKPHNREDNYAQYALSDYDKTYLNYMVQSFKEVSKQKNYSDYDTVLFIISFVQSLEYASDDVTTGYDEYPRYPIETLVNIGGDCEDTSILAAALLNELGYDVVLLELPRHMAIGIRGGKGIYGTYYQYNGNNYYYLETTGKNWDIGEIPEEYFGKNAIVRPLIQIPRMHMEFYAQKIGQDRFYEYYNVRCNIEHIGSGIAKDLKLDIYATKLENVENYMWTSYQTLNLGDYSEGSTLEVETVLKIPKNTRTKIYCTLYGENIKEIEISTKEFYT